MPAEMLDPAKTLKQAAPLEPAPPEAGLPRRAAALFVDALALWILARFVLQNGFAALYPYRWAVQGVGALLFWAYFVIGSSPLTGGQTLGKRLLDIAVIDRRTGRAPGWPRCLARLIFVQLILFPFIPVRYLHFPEVNLAAVTVGIAGFGIGAAYALSTAVFTLLHPRKFSPHDLATGCTVIRAGAGERALEKLAAPLPEERTRLRLALWPTATMAAIVLLLAARLAQHEIPIQRETLRAQQLVERELGNAWSPRHIPPSPERHAAYLERIESMPPDQRPTSDTLRLADDGRKYFFVFDLDQYVSSATLTADPRYALVRERAPGLARQLAERHYHDATGRPYPYHALQMAFIATLPGYMYNERRTVHLERIDVPGVPPRSDDGQSTPTQPRSAP